MYPLLYDPCSKRGSTQHFLPAAGAGSRIITGFPDTAATACLIFPLKSTRFGNA